ncbi:PIN domain-containing protein [Asticcacaulis sp. ZE23SCel15]|uniref:type II toxin-antitoxin system VapC family toxin n=1 Tax=Asticcacaulis sp. ZE23SCel15 TaxID=3059027 RepID=UPI00265DB3B7|nr:PIN domain-containing protein [Asticcacaulis sp. ZE23SCel15]WKL57063.1 PIN domain-containing protein [Asticcacaulis sp. ZE23SCel15]
MIFFQTKLAKEQETLLIPIPVLSEILIFAGDSAPLILERLHKSARFKIVPFDERAAVELAIIHRAAIASGDKKGGSDESWTKIKFDRQIVAIAKVNGADTIYSDDKNLANFAKLADLNVVRVWEMELPPQSDQIELTFPSD